MPTEIRIVLDSSVAAVEQWFARIALTKNRLPGEALAVTVRKVTFEVENLNGEEIR